MSTEHKAYIHEAFDTEIVVRHPVYPDLNILMPRKGRTDAEMLAEVDALFASGGLGPLPNGYAVTKLPETQEPSMVIDYTDWVSCVRLP
jgi:hypothetical protein